MLRKSLPISILCVLLLTSCAAKKLTSAQKNIRVLRKSDAPLSCKSLGSAKAMESKGDTIAQIDNELRISAAKLKGNVVVVDRVEKSTQGFSIHYATVFKCN